jgi:hypothetical protein
MKEYEQQGAQPLPNQESFFTQQESIDAQLHSLKDKIQAFITSIEGILKEPLLSKHPEFLDKFAADIVSLHHLSMDPKSKNSLVNETRKIISNVLNCEVKIQASHEPITAIDAALTFRKHKKNSKALHGLLENFLQNKEETQNLLTELKMISYDLSVERENI